MTLYDEKHKLAIYKHRASNKETYNANQLQYYHKHKSNEQWLKNHNEKCRLANQRYREKKYAERVTPAKPRGRPRKRKDITDSTDAEPTPIIL